MIEMLGAVFIVHITHGFFPPSGFELPLLMCAASAMLMLGGGGLLSIDGPLARRAAREIEPVRIPITVPGT